MLTKMIKKILIKIFPNRRPATLKELLERTPRKCWRCGKPCTKGNQGSWMCDCTSTPFSN